MARAASRRAPAWLCAGLLPGAHAQPEASFPPVSTGGNCIKDNGSTADLGYPDEHRGSYDVQSCGKDGFRWVDGSVGCACDSGSSAGQSYIDHVKPISASRPGGALKPLLSAILTVRAQIELGLCAYNDVDASRAALGSCTTGGRLHLR